ncbi:MAG: hypothetical protein J5736_03610, partial [Bacilli bacterium]|nr:hypothetical protein [Bacilli bacterium]
MKRKISSVFLLSLLAGTLLTSCISRVNHQSSWQNEPSSSSEPIPSSTNPSSSEPSSWTNPPTSSEPYSTHEEPPSSEPEPYVIGIDLNVDYVRKSYLYDQQNPDFVEEFDGSPLQLRVHHSDGSSLTLGWNQVGHSDPDLTMIGSQEVWVAYEGYRTSFWIDVGTYT